MGSQDKQKRWGDDRYRHDLKEAVQTLTLFADALGRGYSFDDGAGDEKRAAVIRSIKGLTAELDYQFREWDQSCQRQS